MSRIIGFTKLFLLLVVPFHLLLETAFAQIIGNAPRNFRLDGKVDEWPKNGPSFSQFDGVSDSPVWIGHNTQGLIIAGVLFSSSQPQLELWLSVTDEVQMPPVSYSGDGATEDEVCDLKEGPAKLSCVQWYRDQDAYRAKLRDLFIRRWRIAPNLVEEVKATPAFESLTNAQRDAARQLKPSGSPIPKFSIDEQHHVAYEILVPWDAFPPIDRLNLERIKLTLNVVMGAGAATDYPRNDGERPTLRSYALVPPIVGHFTVCDYPLADRLGEPVYALWDASLNIRDALTFHNSLACCGNINSPPEGSFSPGIVTVSRTAQQIEPGEFVCSSPIAYRKGAHISRSDFERTPEPGFFLHPDSKPPSALPVLRLPNGTLLVRDGPAWWLREQTKTYCAGCPLGRLAIYAISPSREIRQALSLGPVRVTDLDLFAYDIEVSSDWRTVTEYKRKTDLDDRWTATTYCFSGDIYQQCGEPRPSEGPKHGLFPALMH